MSNRWTGILLGLSLALGIGVITLNFERQEHDTLVADVAPSEREKIKPETTEVLNAEVGADKPNFETSSERMEAEMLQSLDALNRDIVQSKQELDKETSQAQQQETNPEIVIGQANRLLEELQAEGFDFDYQPVLLAADQTSPKIQLIERQIETIEVDLIDIENRFNNLGNNKELEK